MTAFLLMFAVLMSDGSYQMFGESFGTKAACEAQKPVVLAVDIKQHDFYAKIVYLECVEVEARDPIGLNP